MPEETKHPEVGNDAARGAPRSWRHKLAARGSLIAYIVIVAAVLVAINVVASRHDHSWDLTKNHRYSLSPESVKIVADLRQPMELIYFDRSSEFPHAKQFLGRYQRESNRVKVQFVDPDRHPDLANQYKIRTYGTTVVASAGRKQLVTTLDEQDITNAMVRVLKGGPKIVYFTDTEGERDPGDTGRTGYSVLKKALEDENFTVKTLPLAQQPAIPKDCSILVVAGPSHSFVAPEITAIDAYLKGGGRALFMLGPESKGPLVQYLENSLDVKLTPDIVVDQSGIGRLFGASELMPIVANYDTHPITDQMGHVATIFPYARTVQPGDDKAATAVVEPLLETSPASVASTNFANGEVRLNEASALRGPLTLGVAGTLSGSGDKSGGGRFVVFGSADFPANDVITFGGNRDLALNTMNWLAAQESFISIRPKPRQNAPINLNASQMQTIWLSVLVYLPVFIVLCGVFVWLRRRAA